MQDQKTFIKDLTAYLKQSALNGGDKEGGYEKS